MRFEIQSKLICSLALSDVSDDGDGGFDDDFDKMVDSSVSQATFPPVTYHILF